MKKEKGKRGQYKVEDDPVISSARRFPFGVDVDVDVAWSGWSFHDDDSDSDNDTDSNESFPVRLASELFASCCLRGTGREMAELSRRPRRTCGLFDRPR